MQQVVSSEELLAAALQVYEQGKHPLTAMFGRDETLNGAGYAIYCCFEVPEKRDVHIVKGVFPAEGTLSYESLTHAIPAAVWYEREIHDMFGLVPGTSGFASFGAS